MKGEVPRAGARLDRRRRRIVGRERPGFGIEAELPHEIAAEAGRQHEAIVGIGLDGVRVGLGRDDLLGWLHRAVRRDRVHRHLVVGIGGGQQEAAAAVGGDVGHAAVERAVGDVAELAGGGIDAEACRHHRLAARGGEQEFLVRAYRHRRRARRLGDAGNRHLLDRREIAVLRIKLQDVNLVAVGAADIDEGRSPGRQRGGRQRKRRGECGDASQVSLPCVPPGRAVHCLNDRSATLLVARFAVKIGPTKGNGRGMPGRFCAMEGSLVVYWTTISTRRFCGSRTLSPVGTSSWLSPLPMTVIAWAGTPSRTSASLTALARRSDSAML